MPSEKLAVESKFKMHEAREAIISRLSRDLPVTIDLDKFLRAVVSEIGQMIGVDRCDVIQFTDERQLKISHEWQSSTLIPSTEGLIIPIDAEKLSGHFDLTKPLRVNDTSEPETVPPRARLLAATFKTRSLLIVPILLNSKVLGLLGLHDTKKPRVWLDDEVAFLESIAQQLAIGYQYTRLYTDKQQE
ncbi:MAG: GAF domain-containing protein, partial [Pyrinomonadaceae bacterium]|nr:GAF domain-containing protein [Pyrinomonadaceae bacterium]